MLTMTFNEALLIQRAQMSFYRQRIGRSGIKAIKENTFYPVDINPNKKMSVIFINRLVPRGASFEHLYHKKRVKEDPNNLYWHKAITKGFF